MICCATKNSTRFTGISNKSACFYSQERFTISVALDEYCLEHEQEMPDVKRTKLNGRLEKGRLHTSINAVPELLIGLDPSQDPEYPMAIVKDAAEAGRGLYAKYTLSPSTSVFGAPVSPYIAALDENKRGQRCSTCFSLLSELPLIACNACVDAYCSERCRNDAVHHAVECGLDWVRILPIMPRMGLYLYSSAARDSNVAKPGTILRIAEPRGPFDSRPLSSIYAPDIQIIRSLYTHESLIPFDAVFKHHCLDAVLLTGAIDPSRLKVDKRLLLDDILRCNANAFEVVQNTDMEPEPNSDIVSILVESSGFALYALPSLLNHSCNPNTVNSYDNSSNRLIVRAIETIPVGQQIFHCYGPAYYEMVFSERQRKLLKRYYFECHCTACSRDRHELSHPTTTIPFKTEHDVNQRIIRHIKTLRGGESPNLAEAERLEKLMRLDTENRQRLQQYTMFRDVDDEDFLEAILAAIATRMSKFKEVKEIAKGVGFDDKQNLPSGPIPAYRDLMLETAKMYDDAALTASRILDQSKAYEMESKAVAILVHCFPKYSHDMGAEYSKLASIAQQKVFSLLRHPETASETEIDLWLARAVEASSAAYENTRVASGPKCQQAQQAALVMSSLQQLQINRKLRHTNPPTLTDTLTVEPGLD